MLFPSFSGQLPPSVTSNHALRTVASRPSKSASISLGDQT